MVCVCHSMKVERGHRGQLKGVNCFFSPCRSRDQIQLLRLNSKHLYLQSHLAGPCLLLLDIHIPSAPKALPLPYPSPLQLSQSSRLSKHDIS